MRDDKIAAAYKEHYGKDLKTDEDSATAAWVKALAANGPLLTDADEAAAQAVGAPDQKEPFMGLVSSAKFRNNIDAGAKLGLCTGLKPFAGWMYPSLGLIAKGTDSPNAAKLFIHYLHDRRGHRAAGGRRQDLHQQGRQAAGGRALGDRQGARPDLPLRRRDRRRRTGTLGRTGRICGASTIAK